MPICLLIYHFILWSTEQTAIASASQANLAWAGLIGLAAQGILMTGVIAALWRFTTDERFKPVYAGWLGAALMAFPALLLRLLGPNNDQLGSLLQILICVIAAVIVSRDSGAQELIGEQTIFPLHFCWPHSALDRLQFLARSAL